MLTSWLIIVGRSSVEVALRRDVRGRGVGRTHFRGALHGLQQGVAEVDTTALKINCCL